MEPGSTGQIIFLIILVAISAFFSASETALTSLSKIRLRNLVEEKVKNADKLSKLIEDPNKLLSAILIGNNIANIASTAIATIVFIHYFGEKGVGVATLVMTIAILVFGEITPKTFAAQNSEAICFAVVNAISGIVYLLSPLILVMNVITGFIIRLLGGNDQKHAPLITESELKTMVNVSHQEGVLELEERTMINNVFDFGDAKAKDVMTTRTDIIGIEKNMTFNEIINVFKDEHFSRVPVYEDNIDNIIGILHLKDMIFIEDTSSFNIEESMREPLFTYEYKDTDELFALMRSSKTQMAIILDEYGGTSGIVTLEDLVEEIVGEINDEYDEDEDEIMVIKEDEYLVDGSTKIDDVNEMLGINLESEDFDSIGGYVIGFLGRFPEPGEELTEGSIKFVIEEIDKNRIVKLRMFT